MTFYRHAFTRIFDNNGRIFEPKRGEVIKEWRKLEVVCFTLYYKGGKQLREGGSDMCDSVEDETHAKF